jgi:hypothetical protein
MAETNHTSSATNSDCNASSPGVSSDAKMAPEGFNRRKAMTAMTAIAVAPAATFLPLRAASASTANRRDWDRALARYSEAKEAHDRVDAEHNAAVATYRAECGKPNPEFAYYRIDSAGIADRLNRSADIRRVGNEIEARDYAGQAKLSADDFSAIARKATLLVDQYDEYLQRCEALEERVIGDKQDRWEAALDKLDAAQRALLGTPAPDAEAMLYKLTLLSVDMAQADAEFQEDIVALREDARRLFVN